MSTRLESVTESTLLKFVGRGAMALMLPAVIALVSVLWNYSNDVNTARASNQKWQIQVDDKLDDITNAQLLLQVDQRDATAERTELKIQVRDLQENFRITQQDIASVKSIQTEILSLLRDAADDHVPMLAPNP